MKITTSFMECFQLAHSVNAFFGEAKAVGGL